MDPDIVTMADRPDLWPVWDELDGGWPAFMTKDPTAPLYYRYVQDTYPEHCLLALEPGTKRPVAIAHTVPLSYAEPIADGMPEGGWEWAIRQSVHDRLTGTDAVICSALEIMIRPDARGGGLSGRMLAAMRDNVARLGFKDLVAPVRPSGKHAQPHTAIGTYAYARRDDGLPVDAWLRVHVRAGARIVNVAHQSMVIAGTLSSWREWTGLPFDVTGPVEVPLALSPVYCDVDQNQAVYVEPNIWVHHRIG